MRAPLVVAFWGALNGALAATLAGFGEQPAVLILYGGAAAVIEIIAVVLWLSQRRRTGPPAWRLPGTGDSVLLLAGGILLAGLGWAFHWYLAAVAVVPLAAAAMREASYRRQGF
jgi:hypothetical protein